MVDTKIKTSIGQVQYGDQHRFSGCFEEFVWDGVLQAGLFFGRPETASKLLKRDMFIKNHGKFISRSSCPWALSDWRAHISSASRVDFPYRFLKHLQKIKHIEGIQFSRRRIVLLIDAFRVSHWPDHAVVVCYILLSLQSFAMNYCSFFFLISLLCARRQL